MGWFQNDKAWTRQDRLNEKYRKAKRKEQVYRYKKLRRAQRKRWLGI